MEERSMSTEAWLSGPIQGITALLMPLAHSLVQAKHDLRATASGLTDAELWRSPGGAASIGFHLRHIAGSADRLLKYAQGQALSAEQMAALKVEQVTGEPRPNVGQLLDDIDTVIDRVLAEVRSTPDDQLSAVRPVGRARIPSTTIGLLFHIAEHTQRHIGQVVATAKIIRGTAAAEV
jgi:uncharacterized damage-inducible protein DinB